MDPRSPNPWRAGATRRIALFSALVVSVLLSTSLVNSTPAAARPAELAVADTSFDGRIFISVEPRPPCEGRDLSLVFEACRCNVHLVRVEHGPGIPFRVVAHVFPDIVCAQCDPHQLTIPLGQLRAGYHTLVIESVVTVIRSDPNAPDSVTTTEQNRFAFAVGDSCPPPPSGIPYLDQVLIGAQVDCDDPGRCLPVACAGDSIPVALFGVFPNPCLRLKEIRLTDSPVASPMPVPPVVQIVYGVNSCIDVACPAVLTPWSARVLLPPLLAPLPGHAFQLLLEGHLEDDCRADFDSLLGRGSVPFDVVPCSTRTPDCFAAEFRQKPGEECDATYANGRPARLIFEVATGVPLAGLQGSFRIDQTALCVVGVEAIGPAAGMHLDWTRTSDGASFLLLATQGAPIVSPPDNLPPVPVGVLAVEVGPNVRVPHESPLPERARIHAFGLIASDSLGGDVPACPRVELDLIVPGAVICLEAACDLNADGSADVRDLVLFAHCVLGTGPCPDPVTGLDCDRDGGVDLDDVLCCAQVILHGSPPDSTNGRPEARVAVHLDPPVTDASGVLKVPLRLDRADLVGAARLELRYPSARYEVVGIAAPGGARWLPLHESGGDRLALGLIGIGGTETGAGGGGEDPTEASWVVSLRLRAGQGPGGSFALVGSQFAGPDGVALETNVPGLSVPLAEVGSVSLSTPRPNPFGAETRFSVHLSSPGAVDLAVYDLAGRRVATIFRGEADPGVNDFLWRGVRDDGSTAPSGMYFVRVSAAGQTVGRKVLLVPTLP